jgi:hypothetical protein
MAWNQTATSIAQLRSLTFKLYVDGLVAALSAASCNEAGGGAGFECSGVLPQMSSGQHTLELTSVLNGDESAPSVPLIVNVVAAATEALSPLNQAAPVSSTICGGEPQADCYSVRVLASGLGWVTGLTPMPDGRVLFIEDGRQVRIIARDALSTAIALPTEVDRQLTGIAVDTQFEKSRSVFVAWTEFARGVPATTITRYRELENVFGEGAAIATGLPAGPDVSTPLAVDDEGLVYVAVPFDPNTGPRVLGNAGVVMRVDRDGRVPPSNHYGSPIIAESYPSPHGLAIEPSSRRVWLTGSGHERFGDISAFDVLNPLRGAWPIRPGGIRTSHRDSERIDSIAIVARVEKGNGDAQLIIARGGRLQKVSVAPGGAVGKASDLPLNDGYVARTVASDRHGFLYVSVATRDGSSSVLELAKQRTEQR